VGKFYITFSSWKRSTDNTAEEMNTRQLTTNNSNFQYDSDNFRTLFEYFALWACPSSNVKIHKNLKILHLPPHTSKFRNEWSYSFNSTYVFTACLETTTSLSTFSGKNRRSSSRKKSLDFTHFMAQNTFQHILWQFISCRLPCDWYQLGVLNYTSRFWAYCKPEGADRFCPRKLLFSYFC
jgi:hypothetical protein